MQPAKHTVQTASHTEDTKCCSYYM